MNQYEKEMNIIANHDPAARARFLVDLKAQIEVDSGGLWEALRQGDFAEIQASGKVIGRFDRDEDALSVVNMRNIILFLLKDFDDEGDAPDA